MSFLDNLKAKIAPAKEKVADLTRQHGGKIDQGLDKAAQAVDSRTKGKYSDKIRTGTDKAKSALDQLNQDGTQKGGPEKGGQAPGAREDATRPQHPETGARKPEGEGPMRLVTGRARGGRAVRPAPPLPATPPRPGPGCRGRPRRCSGRAG